MENSVIPVLTDLVRTQAELERLTRLSAANTQYMSLMRSKVIDVSLLSDWMKEYNAAIHLGNRLARKINYLDDELDRSSELLLKLVEGNLPRVIVYRCKRPWVVELNHSNYFARAVTVSRAENVVIPNGPDDGEE